MSEAKKEKVQMDPKYILRLAGVLMLAAGAGQWCDMGKD